MSAPFYKNPRVQFTGLLLGLGGVMLVLFWPTFEALFGPFLGQGAFGAATLQALASLAYAGFVLWMTRDLFYRLVSQFALPVSTAAERAQALEHFFRFSSGAPGPAIFVKDGQIIGSASEKENRNVAAGVILVDSASGVVLQNDIAFTRAAGPGVVFTQRGEYIAKALDLRKQTRRLDSVSGMTRDGIELTVDLGVVFALDSGEKEAFRDWSDPAQPPYAFNAFSAYRAVYGNAVGARSGGDWTELPAVVAADVWRERLILHPFDALFGRPGRPSELLEAVRAEVESRLRSAGLSGENKEYRLLEERGVRVLGVSVSNLTMKDELKKRFRDNWQKSWQERLSALAADRDPVIQKMRLEGRAGARQDILAAHTAFLREQPPAEKQPLAVDIIRELVEATRGLARDRAVQAPPDKETIASLLPSLMDLRMWAEALRGGSSAPKGPA